MGDRSAKLDRSGLLTVGPESAGAVPGPACYGQGGAAATVTDANLVLGYLDPANFLGGRHSLDLQAARSVVAKLATELGLAVADAAGGIHRLVNSRMADGVRIATVRRGVDPRQFTLLAFGGAAGLHVTAVAAELGITRVAVPLDASVLSAWGMLNTDLRVELSRSQGQAGAIDVEGLKAAFAAMEDEGRVRLGGFDGEIVLLRSADMRYGEQVFEIAVALDGIDWSAADFDTTLAERFHAAHEGLYTYALRDQDVVLVNARLSAIGRLGHMEAPGSRAPMAAASAKGMRLIHLGGWTEVPVFDFATLGADQQIPGPAIVESDTTTILLRNGDVARYDARGWLEVAVSPSRGAAVD